MTTTTTIIC